MAGDPAARIVVDGVEYVPLAEHQQVQEQLVRTATRDGEVVNVLRNGLLAITTAGDASPYTDAYRDAGGGYEGLQAIAQKALDVAAGWKAAR